MNRKDCLILAVGVASLVLIASCLTMIHALANYERAQYECLQDKRERGPFLVRLRDRNPQAITNSVQMRWPTQ